MKLGKLVRHWILSGKREFAPATTAFDVYDYWESFSDACERK